MQEKIRKLQGQIKEIDLDALIVTNPVNIFYLTGIANFDSEKGFLLVVNAKDWRLITSRFYQSRVEGAIPVKNTVYVERGGSMSENAAEILAKDENIGFERDTISYLQYENLKKARRGKKLLPESDLVARMRTTKNETELALVKKAAAITDKTFLELTKLIKPGVAELFLKRKVLEIMQDLGASGCSFDPIVASGKNAADPHYEGSNKKLKSGEMIVIDIGARYKNYDADLTRMVFCRQGDRQIQGALPDCGRNPGKSAQRLRYRNAREADFRQLRC